MDNITSKNPDARNQEKNNMLSIKIQFVRIRCKDNRKITSIKFHLIKVINKNKNFDILLVIPIQQILYFLNRQFVPWDLWCGVEFYALVALDNKNTLVWLAMVDLQNILK